MERKGRSRQRSPKRRRRNSSSTNSRGNEATYQDWNGGNVNVGTTSRQIPGDGGFQSGENSNSTSQDGSSEKIDQSVASTSFGTDKNYNSGSSTANKDLFQFVDYRLSSNVSTDSTEDSTEWESRTMDFLKDSDQPEYDSSGTESAESTELIQTLSDEETFSNVSDKTNIPDSTDDSDDYQSKRHCPESHTDRKRKYSSSSNSNTTSSSETRENPKRAVRGKPVVIGDPSNVIMISGMPCTIDENRLRLEAMECGLAPHYIRVLRNKDSKNSRGFGFVDFTRTADAVKWMNFTKGALVLEGRTCTMKYSHTKVKEERMSHEDWYCGTCRYRNFKKRSSCYRCSSSKTETPVQDLSKEEISNFATKTIMLRNLHTWATEDQVLNTLSTHLPHLMNRISAVGVGRDPLTSVSRGVCYLAAETIEDSTLLYSTLNSRSHLMIGDRFVLVSYCKFHMGDRNSPYAQFELPGMSAAGGSAQPFSYQGTFQPSNHAQGSPDRVPAAGSKPKLRMDKAVLNNIDKWHRINHELKMQNLKMQRDRDEGEN